MIRHISSFLLFANHGSFKILVKWWFHNNYCPIGQVMYDKRYDATAANKQNKPKTITIRQIIQVKKYCKEGKRKEKKKYCLSSLFQYFFSYGCPVLSCRLSHKLTDVKYSKNDSSIRNYFRNYFRRSLKENFFHFSPSFFFF